MFFRKPALLTDNKRQLWPLPGGIHPPQNKAQSTNRPIRPVPLPQQLVLPLNMHLGSAAKPIVEIGQQVLKGQKIAEAQGAVSVPVHAPTSARVIAIGKRPIQHPSGLDAPSIVLAPDGDERWCELHPLPDWQHCCPPGALLPRLREAGIAGMGGAGFPTAVKLNPNTKHRIEQLIINAVECEPYITADDMLMRERAADIVDGIAILRHILSPAETLIGIEDNKPEAIAAMRQAASGSGIEIVVIPTKYPSGGEKQLIYLLTGKEVPSGGIPAQVGVVCQNVGTAYATARAIIHGEPLISRITTLTGAALQQPGNVEVLLGTPVAHLLATGEADIQAIDRLIMGGPMMGFTLHSHAVPIVKTSNCIIAATATELPPPAAEQPCIRCGSCADVCPADLLPQQLYWHARHREFDRAQQDNLMDCIECGACAYVCPSHIPLVQYYRFAKGEIRNALAEQQKADRARQRFEARQARLDKEQAEKAARRKARLTAPANTSSVDISALKAASLTASAQYKAAVKALKNAEAAGADNIDTLRAEMETLKSKADAAKTAVRNAGPAPTANTAPVPAAAPAAQHSDQNAARNEKMKALKTAFNIASKQHKEASAALARAQRDGQTNQTQHAELEKQVARFRLKADKAKTALGLLVDQAKADLQASGSDLKSLKIEAAQSDIAARDKARELAAARVRGDDERINVLTRELEALQREAAVAAQALKAAADELGISEL